MGQITDIDGNTYKTVIIGNQEWMTENLNVNNYRNGEKIRNVINDEEWSNLEAGAWCYYDNDAKNGQKSGKLYNWWAVNDPRGLAPEGWHIPTEQEWLILIDYLGGEQEACIKLRDSSWKNNYEANNESGFSAIGSGIRRDDGSFFAFNSFAFWWSTTPGNYYGASYANLNASSGRITINSETKFMGHSIRCLKD